MTADEVRSWLASAVTLILAGLAILSVLWTMVRSWTWSPLKQQDKAPEDPPSPEKEPRRIGLRETVIYCFVAVCMSLVAGTLSRSDDGMREAYPALLVALPVLLFSYARSLTRLRLLGLVSMSILLLAAAQATVSYVPDGRAWVRVAGLVGLILGFTLLPGEPMRLSSGRHLLLVAMFVTFGWVFFDIAGALYAVCLLFVPPLVRWTVKTASTRWPWLRPVRQVVVGSDQE